MTDVLKVAAGIMGGKARNRLHGNPGTLAGRRLGGLRSIQIHSSKKTAFKTLRSVRMPRKSPELAELLGILAGDGHVGTYQTSIVTNATTDSDHAEHARNLIKSLFQVPVSLRKRKNSNVIIICVSSKNTCDLLRTLGISSSHKTRDQLRPPLWILANQKFRLAFLRGLLDTDGTVYFDRHEVKGKKYKSCCIAFSNASIPLLDFVEETWKELGYSPTRFGKNVRLRRKCDVLSHVALVGFHNPKHSRKIGV